ncbi:hypothetical protein MAR_010598 [Mya arenaria]|uniref:Uncharacterized protein n=1 Tax=Mya arenaria TaxID=6604 RepID=A0ABY7E217_MYAAR|nr:hypothetical protein MAR_010598 [Mya arenaria]
MCPVNVLLGIYEIMKPGFEEAKISALSVAVVTEDNGSAVVDSVEDIMFHHRILASFKFTT